MNSPPDRTLPHKSPPLPGSPGDGFGAGPDATGLHCEDGYGCGIYSNAVGGGDGVGWNAGNPNGGGVYD